jgi:hypothetical protein
VSAQLTSSLVADFQDIQPLLLATLLIGACVAKVVRALRLGSMAAGLDPTRLFPVRMRSPVAAGLCAAELALGIALIITALPAGTRRGVPVLNEPAASTARIATAVLFLVATCALIELRERHPDAGCGCFGEVSTQPIGTRAIARSALLTVSALVSVGGPSTYLLPPGRGAALLLALLCTEVAVIVALSPEVGEALVRLGYSEPCELRTLSPERSLTSLRRSRQWRRLAGVITSDTHADMWRELCWRYAVYPATIDGIDAEVVFAIQIKKRRPVIQSALVPVPLAGETAGLVVAVAVPSASRGSLCRFLGLSRPRPRNAHTPGEFPARHVGWARRKRPKCGTVNAISPRSEL